jgi:hypothetical protein
MALLATGERRWTQDRGKTPRTREENDGRSGLSGRWPLLIFSPAPALTLIQKPASVRGFVGQRTNHVELGTHVRNWCLPVAGPLLKKRV